MSTPEFNAKLPSEIESLCFGILAGSALAIHYAVTFGPKHTAAENLKGIMNVIRQQLPQGAVADEFERYIKTVVPQLAAAVEEKMKEPG